MHEILWERILARPEDDGLRLVYADWLTEQEDPRGPFIHDQVRLASMDEAHPEWSTLYARSERVRLQHEQDWARPLREAYSHEDVPRPLGLTWRRGWVEGVSLDTRHLCPLEPLTALTPLRAVSLSSPRVLTPADLQPIVQVRPVELGLHARAQPSGPYYYLMRSPVVEVLDSLELPLRALDLTGSKLFPDGAKALARMLERAQRQVRSLSLQDCDVGDAGLNYLLDAGVMGQLVHLGLSGHLRVATLERLAGLGGDEPLSLSLAGTPQADLYGVALLLERRPLSALRLVGQWEVPELDWLLESPGLVSVRRLALPGWFRKPASPGLRKLAAVPFEGLARLDLSSAVFGPGDLQALLCSPNLRCLVSLGLRGTQSGDDAAEALVRSPLTRLTELDLTSCGLTDRGVQLLAGWPGLAHVTRLALSGNPEVRSAGFRALMNSPWFQPTLFECAVPALSPKKGRMRRPRLAELEERFGPALRR
jgi:uncharacterized protein (TIGR02996 family)